MIHRVPHSKFARPLSIAQIFQLYLCLVLVVWPSPAFEDRSFLVPRTFAWQQPALRVMQSASDAADRIGVLRARAPSVFSSQWQSYSAHVDASPLQASPFSHC